MDASDSLQGGAAGADTASVTLRGVSLRSADGARDLLQDIDLAISPAESVAIVGPSGAGKSALLSLIAGLAPPSRGTVRVAGQSLSGLDEAALARFRHKMIGVVAPPIHLAATMTVIENVAGPAQSLGPAEAFARAKAGLQAFGLERQLARYPAQLSPGDAVRVAIARALIGEPALLLADEPTQDLDDAVGQDVIGALLDGTARSDIAMLLATRDATLARRCQRVVRLAEGRIVDDSDPPVAR